ncbi:phosphate propanoyltransferase [Scopulibacillus cellulosilyticus]|uniref:Phosphate propanoyltransferase n=1 Tax=Scopulibacillus cellulosilyticus TaxID=2665665 RepID=A0ABW2PSH0_9BACL
MNKQDIASIIEEVMDQLKGKRLPKDIVPIAVSARHVHLCKSDLESLFGEGFELSKKADLSQLGQFAANETVTIAGPKGSIEKVRILGPARNLSQAEVSKTDAIKLGLNPPLRESGKIEGSSPVTLVGPKGSIYIKEGLIIAQNHIHMTPQDAEAFQVRNGEYVQIKVESDRPVIFNHVLIRVSEKYRLEMHIDTDEANAGLISGGQQGRLIKNEESL